MADTCIPLGGGNAISGLDWVYPTASHGAVGANGATAPYPSTGFPLGTREIPGGHDTSMGFILMLRIVTDNDGPGYKDDQFPALFPGRPNSKVQVYRARNFVIYGEWDGNVTITFTFDRIGADGFTFSANIGYIFFKL